MRSFHVKSIVLGIGIGVIITSILSIIYSAGLNPLSNLSEKDIDKLCLKYGLVRKSDQNKEKSMNFIESIYNKGAGITGEDSKGSEENENKETLKDSSEGISKESLTSGQDNNSENEGETSYTPTSEDKVNKGTDNGKERTANVKPVKSTPVKTESVESEPVKLEPGTEITIQIKHGDSPKEVAQTLYKNGLIEDVGLFDSRIRELGLTRKIIADKYIIKSGTSIDDILKMITVKH